MIGPIETFKMEANEHLVNLEAALLELETNPDNADLIDTAFRAIHTIKGAGGMFGYQELTNFTHHLESVLDKVRNNEIFSIPSSVSLYLSKLSTDTNFQSRSCFKILSRFVISGNFFSIFLEQKLLYLDQSGPVPETPYAISIGKAEIKRVGTDVTVVATSAMVPRAMGAAQQLEREGISVEVVDPRTLRPLDEHTIIKSVRKTNRLLIVHEAWTKGGFGAEVAATVVEHAFDYLDAPIARLGAPDAPMPYNDELERLAIPSQEKITEAIRKLLA